ncbi:hypothetical protein GE21DRAFT_1084305 [Neurospora crassa]|nr:hypothetical protein GE21DRAFT_1084305 [Neurospora crassa]
MTMARVKAVLSLSPTCPGKVYGIKSRSNAQIIAVLSMAETSVNGYQLPSIHWVFSLSYYQLTNFIMKSHIAYIKSEMYWGTELPTLPNPFLTE